MTAPDPTNVYEVVGAMFDRIAAATAAQRAERERLREERRNTPEARRARSLAATKGWETRRAQREAEAAEQAARDADDDEWYRLVGDGPWCESLDFHPVMGEVQCLRDPGHDGDCDDLRGHTWECYE